MGVLSEEPVAWMDGINVRNLLGANDTINFQVTLIGSSFTYTDRFIRHLHVH